MQSKNAIGNLINRYKAVLKKCNLINVFGTLAVVSLLTLGAGSAFAGSSTSTTGETVNASGDTVSEIGAGTLNSYYGGFAQSEGAHALSGASAGDGGTAIADKNILIFQGGSARDITGGHASSWGGNDSTHSSIGGNASSVTANNNTLTMEDGTVTDSVIGGAAYSVAGFGYTTPNGATNTARADFNTVTIKNGIVQRDIHGGYASSDGTNSESFASASYNSVILEKDAEAGNFVIGGRINSVKNLGGEAHNNTVRIYGTVNNSVYGAYTDTPGIDLMGSNNTVYIYNGAKVNGDVFASTISSGENNSVRLNGTITFGANSSIGGYSGIDAKNFKDNTLTLDRYTTTTRLGDVKSFETYNFILPASTVANSTVLSVTNLNLTDGGSQSAKVGSVSIDSGHSLQVGDSVILIDANTIDGSLANDGGTVKSTTGTFVEQEWKVAQDTTNNDITAELLTEKKASSAAGGVANPYSAASAAVLSAATRTAVSVGIPAAQSAAGGSTEGQGTGMSGGSVGKSYGIAPFAVVHGGFNTYHTDSHVDVNSISFMGGIAFNKYFSQGELLLGAFFETGSASYNSYDNSGLTEIHGTGYMDYYGGGLLARYEFYGKGGKPYVEASARMGSLNTSYESDDIIDATTGYGVNYDISANYYGLHVGAGYIWQLAPQWKLDLSAKYFWTHQEGSSAHIGGNKFEFDAMNSHILRAGATLSYDVVEKESYTLSPYVGLAYEYELDGEAGATVDGISVSDTVSSQGGTGVLNLGVNFKHVNGFSVNLGAEGSLGMRDGIMGKLEMKYEF